MCFFVHLKLYQGEGPFFYIRELFFIHFLIPSAHEHFTLTLISSEYIAYAPHAPSTKRA
ncbi:hypothetical protein CULT_2580002 [[Clostridium] ultunense Esp]|nr:hypothetical protein CULT_2580002 [[Clostridium] ultunense Esp]